jgi:hypothetical protein
LVQSAVRDTHAPHKVVDISDLFLVGFGSKDDGGTPRPITWANPTVAEKDLNLGHDDLALYTNSFVTYLSWIYWLGTHAFNAAGHMGALL